MAGFRAIGKRRERFRRQESYWQQAVTRREKLICMGMAGTISLLTGWLFYRSVWSGIGVLPFGVWLYGNLKRERMEGKKSQFLLQFKEMMECVAQALSVGYSAENAFREAKEEMKILYPGKSMIENELEHIVRKLRLQIPMEQVLQEFSQRVELEDVRNFASVFTAAKRSGGDMVAIIQNTVSQISEKIEVKREIDIILASKKYEFRVMCVIPYVMILYLQLSFPEFMGVLYGNAIGIGVMTLCLTVYVGACMLGLRMIRIDV